MDGCTVYVSWKKEKRYFREGRKLNQEIFSAFLSVYDTAQKFAVAGDR